MIRSLRHRLRRYVEKRPRKSLTIFAYHGICARPLPIPDPCFLTGEVFSAQLDIISGSYRMLPLARGIDLLRRGRIDEPCAALTFDDGFAGLYHEVFPLLRERNVPAASFPVASLVGSDDTIWFCRVIDSFARTKHRSIEWEGSVFDLSSAEGRTAASIHVQEQLKYETNAKMEERLSQLAAALDVEPEIPPTDDSPFRMLNSAQIAEMADSGLVEFGGHGMKHTILSLLPAAELEREVAGSIETIGALSRREIDLFAYPNGRRDDYGRETIDMLRRFGIRAAVTMRHGRAVRRSPELELPRYWVDEHTPPEDLRFP